MNKLHKLMPKPVPATAMSATLQKIDSDQIDILSETDVHALTINTIVPPSILSSNVLSIRTMPAMERKWIEEAIAEVFGIMTPRPFQIEAIRHGLFVKGCMLHIIRKTAEGKYLIPLTITAFCCGITIVLVPLIGLGSDQVNSVNVPDHNIESYHLNEQKESDGTQLGRYLLSISKRKQT